jgi:uncharacterized membrane protein YdjX (TVP38/TMEM64 family)
MKILIIAIIVALAGSFIFFDVGQYLSLEYLQSERSRFIDAYDESPLLVIGIFFAVYVLLTALSIPGATLITLLAGALFGTIVGTIIVSFASTLGATCAFLISRYLLRDTIQNKYSSALEKLNKGFEREGLFYLFALRLIPAVPFFVINLVMGITNIKTVHYFFVSQAGMLAGTIVYVFAGTQLATISSLGDILSVKLLIAFCLLGVFPLIAKKLIGKVRTKAHG